MPKNIDDTKFFIDKYYNFLTTDFGFDKVNEYYISYEFHCGYRKGSIEINFACETDGTSLPWVVLKDFGGTTKTGNEEFPRYYHLTEIERSQSLNKIFERRSDRYFPEGSKSDYENLGQHELKIVLQETAEFIKRNPQILFGDFTVFAKKGS